MNIQGFYIYISILNNYFENFKINNELFKNINKINTTYHDNKYGSSLNFIKGINMCKILNTSYCLLCEEDTTITNNSILNNFIQDFNNIEKSSLWDIIILTPLGYNSINKNTILQHHNFNKVYNNTLTSAIIIKKHMLSILLNIFEEIYHSINNETHIKYYTIFNYNNYWSDLQAKYNFYVYNKIFLGELTYNYRVNRNVSNFIINNTINSKINNNIINQSEKIIKYNSYTNEKNNYALKTSKKILFIIIIVVGVSILSCMLLTAFIIILMHIYLKSRIILGYRHSKIYPIGTIKHINKNIIVKRKNKKQVSYPFKIYVTPK